MGKKGLRVNIPDKYVVVDTETSGPSNYVVQMGWCIVEQRKLIDTAAVNIVMPDDAEMSPRAYEVHGLSKQLLAETGVDPKIFMPGFRDFILDAVSSGYGILGTCFVTFDSNVINAEMRRHSSVIPFNEMPVTDIGLMYKAWKLSELPFAGESEWDFYHRVSNVRRAGVKYSLSTMCSELGIDPSGYGKQHDAGVDCTLTHLVTEKFREKGKTWEQRKR